MYCIQEVDNVLCTVYMQEADNILCTVDRRYIMSSSVRNCQIGERA